MKKLLLLVILASLASCGGKQGAPGTDGRDGRDGRDGTDGQDGENYNLGHDVLTDFLSNSANLDLLKKYVSEGDTVSNLLEAPANMHKLIYKEINTGKVFLIDTTTFDPTNATWNTIDSYIVNNRSAIFVAGQLFGLSGASYTFFSNSDFSIFYFSEDTQSSKDLESIGSRIESVEAESVKESLLSYGLSVERTEKLSKLLTSYKKISNKRALNASEKDVFTKELLGMNFERAAKEMVQDYNGLIETAADKNGVSPEAVKELVNEFLSK